jgi:hypothetical protein
MKCYHCNNQTNSYQRYYYKLHLIPICKYHQYNSPVFNVPDHIPQEQHQLYLYQKHNQLSYIKKNENT